MSMPSVIGSRPRRARREKVAPLVFKLKTKVFASRTFRALLLLATLASSACTTPEVCTALGDCGGDLLAPNQKSRTFAFSSSCGNDVAAAPNVPSLLHQPPTLAGEVPPKRTQVNFCSEMVLSPDKSIPFIQPWYPSIPVDSGDITYKDDGTYTGSIIYRGVEEMDFAAGCFLSQGFKVEPDGTAPQIDTITCEDFTPVLAKGLATQPNLAVDHCVNDGAAGCQCVVKIDLFTAMQGNYVTIGHTISHTDTLFANPISNADYCARGNQLELTGYKRTFLFNQPALRSMTLVETSSVAK